VQWPKSSGTLLMRILFNEKQKRINALRLRKLQVKFPFMAEIRGNLIQKYSRRSKQVGDQIIEVLKADVANSKWKFVPRARLAVKMTFFGDRRNAPSLHNLVKYYMDLLNGVVFKDDRQVAYLEAFCYQTDEKADESRVYIQVERFSDYQERLKCYFEYTNKYDTDLTTGQKFDNLPPDNKIELLEVGY
jgi:hypothetical protein